MTSAIYFWHRLSESAALRSPLSQNGHPDRSGAVFSAARLRAPARGVEGSWQAPCVLFLTRACIFLDSRTQLFPTARVLWV